MQIKTSITKTSLFIVPSQDQITMELINVLKKLLVSNLYLTYKTSGYDSYFQHELSLNGQLDFFFASPLDQNAIQNIRSASDIWNNMDLIYRLTILDAYSTLYQKALSKYSASERTILFCQIFINDFVDVITSN